MAACGILDNALSFGDLLDVYESALFASLPSASSPIKRTNSSSGMTSALAEVVKRGIDRDVFISFWKGIAAKWGGPGSSVNGSLSRLILRRISPVLALSASAQLRPALYDPQSVGLLRQHSAALEALFIRYAGGSVGDAEIKVDDHRHRAAEHLNASDHTMHTKGHFEHVLPRKLGMTEKDFKAFCQDLSLLPQIFSLDVTRTVFRECGQGWITFVDIGGGGYLVAGIDGGVGQGCLSFPSFCESLLRLASLLNLSEFEPSESTTAGSAHLDVLLHCLDSAGAIFFKSKARMAASPVQRSLGQSGQKVEGEERPRGEATS